MNFKIFLKFSKIPNNTDLSPTCWLLLLSVSVTEEA